VWRGVWVAVMNVHVLRSFVLTSYSSLRRRWWAGPAYRT
jgi:hypothetical protein